MIVHKEGRFSTGSGDIGEWSGLWTARELAEQELRE
jgi:hypothetical protein